jgi:glycosyltransferase involved in cell wall biosynthesis
MTKKKILFVINTLGQAGAEKAMIALMHFMDPEKYDLSLYVLLNQGELITQIPSHVKILNKHFCDQPVLSEVGRKSLRKTVCHYLLKRCNFIHNIPYLFQNSVKMLYNKNIQTDKLLWKCIADGADRFNEDYDLAISFLEGGSAYYVARHVHAKKKAAFIHIDYKQSGYTKALDRNCYDSFDRIFTVSNEVLDCFLDVYPEHKMKTSVFHNFINTDDILTKASQPGFCDQYNGLRLLTVGRLTYQKGYDITIKAMKLLKDSHCNVRWYVIGDGPEYRTLSNQIKQYGLVDDFILLGSKTNPYPYIKEADIYIHATRFEGKSIAIQEAQTLGCCIIASDCSGNREQINDGNNGLLCKFSPEDIAKAVMMLIESEQLRKELSQNTKKIKINHVEDLQLIDELLVNECK